jgi:hypothetical protein
MNHLPSINIDDLHKVLEYNFGWVLVAHACNPSYSGARDQEDHSLKPDWEILSQKTLSQKNWLVEWLKVKALSSSPSTTK